MLEGPSTERHGDAADDAEPAGGTPPSMLVLGNEPAETRRARRWAVEQVVSAGLDALSEDVDLVVAELVANALLHAGPPAELTLRPVGPRIRVDVRDSSPYPPVRGRPGTGSMTGRGLRLIEGIAQAWGVDRQPGGKRVWVELEAGASAGGAEAAVPDADALLDRWAPDEPHTGERHTVRLVGVPTDLLLAAKAHVDDLVREFRLAAAGAQTGVTEAVPRHLAQLLQSVVVRFAEARELIKRQGLAAAAAGQEELILELTLPPEAADAGEQYLQALDEIDGYCRAARLLTLETPPRQRVFRRWYVEELVGQLRRAAGGRPATPPVPFAERLLAEIDAAAEAQRVGERSARLNTLIVALAGAITPEEVAERTLSEGVAAMGASGGGMLLATGRSTLDVPGTVGYDESVVAGLRAESPDAELPAACALRTGQPVWLESRAERDARFPALVGLEPQTIAMCALPLVAGEKCLGALRFSFSRARLFDAEERAFALSLAAQTAQALDRALLYKAQAETARRLQQ